jgi:flagellar hook protein FlgE
MHLQDPNSPESLTNTWQSSINGVDKDIQPIEVNLNTLNLTENQFGTIKVKGANIYIQQDNGGEFLVGRLATASFTNKDGLIPIDDELYKNHAEITGGARSTIKDTDILNNSLELSNASISKVLLSLMSLQRSYEAASKSISTSDEFMKTAINLVR